MLLWACVMIAKELFIPLSILVMLEHKIHFFISLILSGFIIGESTLPWATPYLGPSLFFKWKENKYFSLYAYCFIFESDLLNTNFVLKNRYFILFFLEIYFFDKQSKFLDIPFYWNKKVKHRFICEGKLK